VRNHNNRHSVLVTKVTHRCIKLFGNQWVKPCSGLVQKKHLVGGAKCTRKQNSLLLTARKRAITLLRNGRNAEQLHVAPRPCLCCAGVKRDKSDRADISGKHHLINACGKVALRARLLRKISYLSAQAFIYQNITLIGGIDAENYARKC